MFYKIDFEHNDDLIYNTKCPEPTCIDDYVGESAYRIIDRIKYHSGRNHRKVTQEIKI